MKVMNMLSSRSLRKVANQFVIENDGIVYFQSYETLIAKREKGKLTLDFKWDYSRTTLKYLCKFLNIKTKKEIAEFIEMRVFVVENLNAE